jgi:hypothetical protein
VGFTRDNHRLAGMNNENLYVLKELVNGETPLTLARIALLKEGIRSLLDLDKKQIF